VDSFGQLDTVVLVGAHECITRLSCCTAATPMGSQKPNHQCELLRMIGEKGRGLDGFGVHDNILPNLRTK